MEILDIKKELAGNAYPGRGIVIGKSADGVHAVIAYFIMGRSVNSRNRVFVEQGDGILFDTRLAPRTGDLAFCEVCGERVLKYIRKRGRELWLLGGGTDDTLPVDGETEARVLGVVTVVIKVRRFKRRRTRLIDRLPQKEQPALFERRGDPSFVFSGERCFRRGAYRPERRADSQPGQHLLRKGKGPLPD